MWAGEKIKLAFAGCHDFLVVNAGWTPSPSYRPSSGASSSTWSTASSSAFRFDQGLVEEKTALSPTPAPAPTPAPPSPSFPQASQVPPSPSPSSALSPPPAAAPSPSPASPSPVAALADPAPFPALSRSPPAPALFPVRVETPAPPPSPSPSRSVPVSLVKAEPVEVRPARRALFDFQARFRSEVRRIDKCILLGEDDEAAGGAGGKKKKRKRVDQIAASNLEQYALNEEIKIQLIGVVPGVEIGDTFCCRAEARLVGLHNHNVAGIGVIAHPLHRSLTVNVAASVVLNRGSYYRDNRDYGEVIVYSGQGGFAPGSKKPKMAKNKNEDLSPDAAKTMEKAEESSFPDDAMIDEVEESDKGVMSQTPNRGNLAMVTSQTPNRGNLAMMNSLEHKLPVRVIRGYHGPEFGRFKVLLSYDGLYMVTKSSYEQGERGNYVYKFVMERLKNQPPIRFYDGVPVSPPPPELRLGSHSSSCSHRVAPPPPPLPPPPARRRIWS